MSNIPFSASGKQAFDVARQATMEAGRLLVDTFSDSKEVTFKGPRDVVTNLDFEVEGRVIDLLRREYPNFGIVSEERGTIEGQSPFTWILDPLDGTRNYALGNPFFAVNIGLARDDEIVLGLTYDPMRDELFHAVKGEGAFLNDARISVSERQSVQDSVLGLDMGYDEEGAKQALLMLASLWRGMQTVRIMGSAALGLAYAASGRIDLYVHHSLSPWDLMSGVLLVREAGGVATEGDGAPACAWSRSVIATNSAIHKDFLRLTRESGWRRSLADGGAGQGPAAPH